MSNYTEMGYALDWDSCIEHDSPNYTTFPEGEYPFTVTAFERQMYTPSAKAKLPHCKMIILSLQVEHGGELSKFQHRLYLYSSVEWMLCNFFISIGHRKHGDKKPMNWDAVLGATGLAKIGVREYVTDKGENRTINEVIRFLDPEVSSSGAMKGYTPGEF